MWKLIILLCVAATCAARCHDPDTSTDPVARSAHGTFRGSWMQTRRNRTFQAFRNIRYAEPPVGNLRFQPPKLVLSYDEEVDASEEGPACPLPVPPTYYVDENCLKLNVYTPTTKPSKPLPVIFFIHAGGFFSMTGRSDVAGPHYLLDHDVVLVTINYRIGTLGFMSTGDKYAPGNNGMKDQVAALRWVQRNIAAFGGDPAQVTATGCSAGSISVILHTISPMSKGLFKRGIAMSGSPFSKGPMETHQRYLAVKQAQILNCPTNSSKEIVDCLMQKGWREIGDSLPKFDEIGSGDQLVGLWGPVLEPDFGQERFLVEQPLDSVRNGRMRSVPLIISQTRDEFFWLAFGILNNKTYVDKFNSDWDNIGPKVLLLPEGGKDGLVAGKTAANELRQHYVGSAPLANDQRSQRGLGMMYAISIMNFPVHRLANLMCRRSTKPVYYYEFSYIGNHSHYEDPDTGKPRGVAHHDDLIYLFSLSYRFPIISPDSPDSKMVDQMTTMWYNFAKSGNPNPLPSCPAVSWPTMRPDERCYLRVADPLEVHRNLKEGEFGIWERLYPMEY